MKSYIQKGDIVDVVLSGTVAGGSPLLVGAALFGVTQIDGVSGDTVPLVRDGVFSDMPKDTAAAWAVGDALYWDNTAKKFTKTSASNTLVGFAAVAALIGDTTGVVGINKRVG